MGKLNIETIISAVVILSIAMAGVTAILSTLDSVTIDPTLQNILILTPIFLVIGSIGFFLNRAFR